MRMIILRTFRLVDVFLQVSSKNWKRKTVVGDEDDELSHIETQEQL